MDEFENAPTFAECGSVSGHGFKEPVCIHTDQVYDSCKDRDCIKDQRVYFTKRNQEIVDRAINIKVKSAEIIWIYATVEPVPFNRGFFTVDIKYFIKVRLDAFKGVGLPIEIDGLTTYDKKVILFGSEGKAKIFHSKFSPCDKVSEIWEKNNLPTAIVEVVDPIALSAKIAKKEECCCCCNDEHFVAIPENISECFGEDLIVDDCERNVLVTLGIFTIVKIERNVELLIDAIDFCIPKKECKDATEKNPCKLFDSLSFPIDEFFPPQKAVDFGNEHGCGC